MAKSKTRKKRKVSPVEKPVLHPAVPTVAEIRDLLMQGNATAAKSASAAALASRPDNPEFLNLCGVATAQTGDHRTALSLLETALAFQPTNADARMNLGNVLSALGQIHESEAAYSRVIDQVPDHADAFFNRALVRRTLGRFIEALEDFNQAIELREKFADAYLGRASVYQALGRLSEAKVDLNTALIIRPPWPEALTNRAAILHDLGDASAAKADLDKALQTDPAFVEARYNLGVLLQEIDEGAQAVQAYRATLKSSPDHVGARINLAWALHHQGDDATALIELKKVCRASPDYDKAHVNWADLKRCTGDVDGAVADAAAYLQRHPENPSMIAFLAIAEAAAGHDTNASAVLGLETLIKPIKIDWSLTGTKQTAMNDALEKHILAHPSLQDSPTSHATRNGGHTGNLMVEPLGPMGDFARVVETNVRAYQRAVSSVPDHPFVSVAKPESTDLHVWGVAMRATGHQKSHNHPSAWLSGVYYVRTPCMAAGTGGDDMIMAPSSVDQDAHAGWIEFGRPPDDFENVSMPQVRLIKPAVGAMILFPSYLYHRTIPHAANDLRISIAFDVFPII